jgi:hypothetical protein
MENDIIMFIAYTLHTRIYNIYIYTHTNTHTHTHTYTVP